MLMNEADSQKGKEAQKSKEAQEGSLGKDRISAFSDGVFAIAVTLLVLDIRVPDPAHTTSAQLPGRLLHLWPELASYALSFLIIGVYWVAHHLMLSAVQRADRTLLWINNALLLGIGLIPFSAGLLGQFRHDPLAVAVYGLNLVAVSVVLEMFWVYLTRTSHLGDAPIAPWLVRAGHGRTLASIAVYSSATVLAFVSPTLSVALYWLVPIGYAVFQSRDDARAIPRRRKAAKKPSPHSGPEAQTPPA